MSECNCTTCECAKEDILKCLQVYNKYKWLVDTYVLDYYVKDHWSLLSKSWKFFFENLTFADIGSILDPFLTLPSTKKVVPLEILALRKVLQNLNTSRFTTDVGQLYKRPMKHTIHKSLSSDLKSEFNSYNSDEHLLNNPRLKNSFWKRITPKKKHEITVMAQICSTVARHSDCNIVLDFGSGLGHLSRILAYGYGLKVCCLEAQEVLSKEAQKLDLQFEVTASKYLSENQVKNLNRPIHINKRVENTMNLNSLVELVKNGMNLNDDFKFGVVGLHPCGDLAAILIRFFKENQNVKFINLASCCYMKLTTKTEQHNLSGYPLSKFSNSKEHELSYISRELACHAIETYIERLSNGDAIDLKTHAYRALLETKIIKHWPQKSHTGLRNVKCTKDMTFFEYSCKALNGLDCQVPEDELKCQELNKCLENWKNVVVYYSLRLMFAPMIETIILLDRFLYVAESDTECALVPVFDPKLSPRNHILIATKNLK